MPETTVDAVVIGGGPNGLVAACRLADAGWDTVLLEAADHVGGAVSSLETHPGYIGDRASAFYPLAAASPHLQQLDLHHHGLEWAHAPAVVAHPGSRETEHAAVLHRTVEDTAAGLEAQHPGDGDTWMHLFEQWKAMRDPLLGVLLDPFPPVVNAMRLLRRMGRAPVALRLARTLLLPLNQLGDELFKGQDGRLLLAGNAMHADIPAVAAGSGGFGWLLCMLGQDVGYPVPVGGAGALARAIASRAQASGADIRLNTRVEHVVVGGGRALGVVTADGHRYRARRAVIADVSATSLFRDLLPREAVPKLLLEDLDERFTWDLPTVKINWALNGRIPWRAEGAAGAGTVHLGADERGLSVWSAQLSSGQDTDRTFLLLGQMAVADPTRAPSGHDSVWAYSHLPRGLGTRDRAEELARRMQAEVEAHAPGFESLIVEREVQGPESLEEMSANLVGGAVNGGTAQLHQQAIFRPVPGLGRPETPVPGLYLASAGAHPGGGVHGGPGNIAARAALRGARLGGLPARGLSRVTRHLTTSPPEPTRTPPGPEAARVAGG